MYINKVVFDHLAKRFEIDDDTVTSLNQLRLTAPEMLLAAEPRFDYMNSHEGVLTLLNVKFNLAEQEYITMGSIFPNSIESLEAKPALSWLYNFPAKLNYLFKKGVLEKENHIFIREHDPDKRTELEEYIRKNSLFMKLQAEQVSLTSRMLNSTVTYKTHILNEFIQGYSLIVERRLKDLQSGFDMGEDPGEYETNYWTSCYDAFSKLLKQ